MTSEYDYRYEKQKSTKYQALVTHESQQLLSSRQVRNLSACRASRRPHRVFSSHSSKGTERLPVLGNFMVPELLRLRFLVRL